MNVTRAFTLQEAMCFVKLGPPAKKLSCNFTKNANKIFNILLEANFGYYLEIKATKVLSKPVIWINSEI